MQAIRTQRCAAATRRKAEVAGPSMRTVSVAPRALSGCRAQRSAAIGKAAPSGRSLVVAQAASQPSTAPAAGQTEKKEWYALVASAEFFFANPQNESLAEQLRERLRFFGEQKRENDIFIVPNPKWLETKYPNEAKLVKRPCVALVSTDKMWIVYMKLRLDRVLRFDMGPIPDAEVLDGGASISVESMKMPGKWTAPYAAYSSGWWEKFYPGAK